MHRERIKSAYVMMGPQTWVLCRDTGWHGHRPCDHVRCDRPIAQLPSFAPEVRIKTHRRYCLAHTIMIGEYRAHQFGWDKREITQQPLS